MNILFVTEDHSVHNYGITTLVSQLADQLILKYQEINLTILSTSTEMVPHDPRIGRIMLPITGLGRIWGWNNNLIKTIEEIVNQQHIDGIHLHGIWMAAQWAALKISKKHKIPMVTPSH